MSRSTLLVASVSVRNNCRPWAYVCKLTSQIHGSSTSTSATTLPVVLRDLHKGTCVRARASLSRTLACPPSPLCHPSPLLMSNLHFTL
jgi:hypothetical protein